MTEASRVQTLLNEQNAEIDRLKNRIEQLEAANLKAALIKVDDMARIEQLEAALEKIAQHDMQAIAMDALRPGERIRKALEGKDD